MAPPKAKPKNRNNSKHSKRTSRSGRSSFLPVPPIPTVSFQVATPVEDKHLPRAFTQVCRVQHHLDNLTEAERQGMVPRTFANMVSRLDGVVSPAVPSREILQKLAELSRSWLHGVQDALKEHYVSKIASLLEAISRIPMTPDRANYCFEVASGRAIRNFHASQETLQRVHQMIFGTATIKNVGPPQGVQDVAPMPPPSEETDMDIPDQDPNLDASQPSPPSEFKEPAAAAASSPAPTGTPPQAFVRSPYLMRSGRRPEAQTRLPPPVFSTFPKGNGKCQPAPTSSLPFDPTTGSSLPTHKILKAEVIYSNPPIKPPTHTRTETTTSSSISANSPPKVSPQASVSQTSLNDSVLAAMPMESGTMAPSSEPLQAQRGSSSSSLFSSPSPPPTTSSIPPLMPPIPSLLSLSLPKPPPLMSQSKGLSTSQASLTSLLNIVTTPTHSPTPSIHSVTTPHTSPAPLSPNSQGSSPQDPIIIQDSPSKPLPQRQKPAKFRQTLLTPPTPKPPPTVKTPPRPYKPNNPPKLVTLTKGSPPPSNLLPCVGFLADKDQTPYTPELVRRLQSLTWDKSYQLPPGATRASNSSKYPKPPKNSEFFNGSLDPLSNFWASGTDLVLLDPLSPEDSAQTFGLPTGEHWHQLHKAYVHLGKDHPTTLSLLSASLGKVSEKEYSTGRYAKSIGSSIKLTPTQRAAFRELCVSPSGPTNRIIIAKFLQSSEFRSRLMTTGTRTLIHTALESYWGMSTSLTGANMLGVALMRLRDIVRFGLSGSATKRPPSPRTPLPPSTPPPPTTGASYREKLLIRDPQQGTNQHTVHPIAQTPGVLIVGDSYLRNLKGFRDIFSSDTHIVALSGFTISQVAHQLRQYDHPQWPDVLVVHVGLNNHKHVTPTIHSHVRALRDALERFHSHNTRVLLSPIPIPPTLSPAYRERVDDINCLLRSLPYEMIPFGYDLETDFRGYHWSNDCAERWASVVEARLSALRGF